MGWMGDDQGDAVEAPAKPETEIWRKYLFTPKPDITTYELSTILANVLGKSTQASPLSDGVYFQDSYSLPKIFESYGPDMADAARHFVRTDTTQVLPYA